MKRIPGSAARLLLTAAALAAAGSPAHADYFVRPYVALGAEVIDGYEANGSTQRAENFTSDLQAEVDLAKGTVRNYLHITGPNASAQTAGVMGDRLSFNNAAGTTLGFSFDFDGTIQSPAVDPNLNSTLQIGYYATLYVFEAAAGATYQNFNTLEGALVAKSMFTPFTNPTEALNEAIAQSMAGSFQVAQAGPQSYDVFASLSVFANINSNPVAVTLDFLHTGTFGVQSAPGVSFTSDSGVFLRDANLPAVPEPQTYALLALGLAAVGLAARRRRA
jgi:hypothetical protein